MIIQPPFDRIAQSFRNGSSITDEMITSLDNLWSDLEPLLTGNEGEAIKSEYRVCRRNLDEVPIFFSKAAGVFQDLFDTFVKIDSY